MEPDLIEIVDRLRAISFGTDDECKLRELYHVLDYARDASRRRLAVVSLDRDSPSFDPIGHTMEAINAWDEARRRAFDFEGEPYERG